MFFSSMKSLEEITSSPKSGKRIENTEENFKFTEPSSVKKAA